MPKPTVPAKCSLSFATAKYTTATLKGALPNPFCEHAKKLKEALAGITGCTSLIQDGCSLKLHFQVGVSKALIRDRVERVLKQFDISMR